MMSNVGFTADLVQPLDHELFNDDMTEIDTLKVVTKIWHNRGDISIVARALETLSMFIDEKKVFKDIEYYLPQLTHILVHFDHYNQVQSLEKFLVLLSQTSVHVAMQIMFILGSFMEDYQTEDVHGNPNPNGDSYYYTKCARMLVDVERAAVYGNTHLSEAERVMISQADSASQKEGSSCMDVEDMKRNQIANELTRVKTDAADGSSHSGELLYKRVHRKSMFHSKGWKSRFFTIENRCLVCYREEFTPDPLRAMFLQYCRVEVPRAHPKYPDTYFEVVNDHTQIVFQLRASSAQERQHWVEMIEKEIQGAPAALGVTAAGADMIENAAAAGAGRQELRTQTSSIIEDLLTANQRKNFKVIQQQQLFVVNMTNICEALRFRERAVRKFLLRGAMSELVTPPLAYIPLCSSQDPMAVILRTIPEEAHAFTTKARVPCLMLFELQEHPHKTDLATFFGLHLDSYTEEDIVDSSMTLMKKCSQVAEAADVVNSSPKATPTRFLSSGLANNDSVWKPQGTGIRRLSICKKMAERPVSVSSMSSVASMSSIGNNAIVAASTPTSGTELSAASASGSFAAGPTSSCIGERFEAKEARILDASPNKNVPNRRIGGLIAKSNDDVRQEVFVVQLIAFYKRAFEKARLPLWLMEYRILSCSKSTGLIELIPNTSSLDGIKKHSSYPGSLRAYYEQTYGPPDSPGFKVALDNYISSMAAYSVVSYLLAIKDRHNGNVMLDADGHVIHIDFGFVFGLAPGKKFSMEKAPWKLTVEMVDVMGGLHSPHYEDYVSRCTVALREARRHAEVVCVLMEIMSFKSNYPAFKYNSNAISEFRGRLLLNTSDSDLRKEVEHIITKSYNHAGTSLYDRFQLQTNGIVI